MNDSITGKRLPDVDPALFNETLQALLNDGISPSGAPLSPDEARIVAEKLACAKIRTKCNCGDANCNTYYFDVPAKPQAGVWHIVIRFYARGEHLLHIDGEGNIEKLQRLYIEGTQPLRLFTRLPDGSWDERLIRGRSSS
jgi:hypothetical protein